MHLAISKVQLEPHIVGRPRYIARSGVAAHLQMLVTLRNSARTYDITHVNKLLRTCRARCKHHGIIGNHEARTIGTVQAHARRNQVTVAALSTF